MARSGPYPSLSLPRGWSRRVRSAVLHAISPARLSVTYVRGWAANSLSR